jgi:hypothetical protein
VRVPNGRPLRHYTVLRRRPHAICRRHPSARVGYTDPGFACSACNSLFSWQYVDVIGPLSPLLHMGKVA